MIYPDPSTIRESYYDRDLHALHAHERTIAMGEHPHGILTDYTTGEPIGPATREQREASDAAGETGAFTIDRDGGPCDVSADPAVFGPLRTVYVQP